MFFNSCNFKMQPQLCKRGKVGKKVVVLQEKLQMWGKCGEDFKIEKSLNGYLLAV